MKEFLARDNRDNWGSPINLAKGCCSVGERPFDLSCLESPALLRLFCETASHVNGIRIEIVPTEGRHRSRERHPASTVGIISGAPTIQFADSLDRLQRIEAIAHELAHLLLVYRYGLGVVGRRIPRHGDSEDVFRFFMSMRGDWVYLLGQIANTTHHLILIDYLKEEYGIESSLHLDLLHHNFCIIVNDNSTDKESQHAKGLIAFEYEKLMGGVGRLIDPYRQPEFFSKGYCSAQKYFGNYSCSSIPTASIYKEGIVSFLEDLAYQREDFVFFPQTASDSPTNTENSYTSC